MAKKVVATLKTGAYSFKEVIVHNDHVKDAINAAKGQ